MDKQWVFIEQHFDAQLYPYHIYMDVFVNDFEQIIGTKLHVVCLFYKNGNFTQLFEQSDWAQFSRKAAEALFDPRKAQEVAIRARKGIDLLFSSSKKILNSNLTQLSGEQIGALLKDFNRSFAFAAQWGTIFAAAEHENSFVSKRLKSVLAEKINERKLNCSVNDVFETITFWPESTYVNLEKQALLEILERKLAGMTEVQLEEAIQEHTAKFNWIAFAFQGPLLDEHYFKTALLDLERRGVSLTAIKLEEAAKEEQRSQLIEKLGFTGEEETLVNALTELSFLKAFRKDAEFHGNYALSFVFKQAAKRFGIPITYARMLIAEELIKAFETDEINELELAKRTKAFAYYYEGGKRTLYSGDPAEQFEKLIPKQEVEHVDQLIGEVACKGIATGSVKVVHGKADYDKFNDGDVLVSVATNPNMVPLMKRACAIVTDVGGITCHAAIVSRELSKPCVIGTKIGTKALRDGEMIEVDAVKGIVRKLK